MQCIIAFIAGACVGMVITSIFTVSGRCAYEERVRKYYEDINKRRW